ncbi:hypothetical protein CHS0354_017591 [Potamilus streckersoni]|uniref:Uncharacterized protein n=1 Tax=Potamilus streckersoni TaxID=2493646 RepID=A0AAE0VHI4_9BIVA|nr:hypothetical protein CHS0354_017591 [Potamilus streckersoni]
MPEQIMEQMKKVEKHLQTFIKTNEANICKLDTKISNLVDEIRAIRTNVNERLDEIERMVTTEGCKIYKDEMVRRQEENQQCQNFITAVKSSLTFLESTLKYGTDTQKFLVSKTSVEKLKFYVVQVYRRNFPCYDISESQVTLNTRRPRRDSQVNFVSAVDIQSSGKKTTFYSGGVQLPGEDIVLADHNNKICILYDSNYQFITSFTLQSHPKNMCLVHDDEVAVTLTDMATIQLLSIRDKIIKVTRTVKSRYLCYGVVARSREEVVVTGPTDDRKNCYWSIISKTTGEKYLHEFYCHRIEGVYVTLNNSKSRVYISVELCNSVYCFGVTDARQYFAYASNDLHHPLGVAVDKEDNLYVVGHNSQNIHKLSPEGNSLFEFRLNEHINSRICRHSLSPLKSSTLNNFQSFPSGDKLRSQVYPLIQRNGTCDVRCSSPRQ